MFLHAENFGLLIKSFLVYAAMNKWSKNVCQGQQSPVQTFQNNKGNSEQQMRENKTEGGLPPI